MEQRVARLEIDVAEIKGDIKALIRDLAELKGKVSNMPTAWQIVGLNFGLAIGVAGLVFTIAKFAAH